METLVRLIRTVSRLFYQPRQTIALDLLSQNIVTIDSESLFGSNGVVPEEELAFLMRMQVGDLRKLLGRLRHEGIVKIEQRSEPRKTTYEPKFVGQKQRMIHKFYYYIDYQAVYTVIKYKVWKVTSHLRQNPKIITKSQQNAGGLVSSRGGTSGENEVMYQCPRCSMQFSVVEATKYAKPPTFHFVCPYHREDEIYELELIKSKAEQSYQSNDGNYLKQWSELLTEMGIVQMLKQLEGFVIPRIQLDKEIAKIVKDREMKQMIKDQQAGQLTAEQQKKLNQQQGKSGIVMLNQGDTEDQQEQQFTVEIEDSTTLKQKGPVKLTADEIAAQEKIRVQNIMPIWHQKSTVIPMNIQSGQDAASQISQVIQKNQVTTVLTGAESTVMDPYATTIIGPQDPTSFGVDDEEEKEIMDYYEQYYAQASNNVQQSASSVEVFKESEDEEDFEEVDVDLQLSELKQNEQGGRKRKIDEFENDIESKRVRRESEDDEEEFEEV